MGLFAILSINDIQRKDTQHNDTRQNNTNVALDTVMLRVIMLNVIMLNVVVPSTGKHQTVLDPIKLFCIISTL
jgi:hypothetical protein